MIKGNFKELPKFSDWGKTTKSGFMFFLYTFVLMIPIYIVMFALVLIPRVGIVLMIIFELLLILFVPIIVLDYVKTEKFGDGWKIKKALKMTTSNLGEYIVVFLKTFVLSLLFMLLSIPLVTIIVTYPALTFTQNIFLVEFYRTHK